MDTYMSLAAYGDDAQEALAAAAREINRLERELSRTIATSDVYKINADGAAAVSDETAAASPPTAPASPPKVKLLRSCPLWGASISI